MSASVGTTDPSALKLFRDHLLNARAATSSDLQEGVYKCARPLRPTSEEAEPAPVEQELRSFHRHQQGDCDHRE